MTTNEKVYLGDGLYAHFDGMHIMLTTERVGNIVEGPVTHFVGMEPEVFAALLQFAMRIGWLKKGDVLG